MSVTSLKLPDALKARIAPLAESSGKTPHAWMVEAIENQVALAEMHEDFIAEAEQAAADVDAGGVLYAAEDIRAYVVSLAKGANARRPRPLPAKATTRPAKSRRSA